jgi:hypothetical protein
MASITVKLSDDVYAELKAKLGQHGYSVEQFVESSLHNFLDAGTPLSPELEQKVLDALDSPLLNAEQIDWDAKIRRLEAQRKSGAA